MKLILRLNKLIVVSCLGTSIFLLGCHLSGNTVSTESATRVNKTIYIIHGEIGSGKLNLRQENSSSADVLAVTTNTRVIWQVLDNAIIKKIDTIFQKPTSTAQVFKPLPKPSAGNSNLRWEGSIASDARGKVEDYNIRWIDSLGNSHTYDPKIQVK